MALANCEHFEKHTNASLCERNGHLSCDVFIVSLSCSGLLTALMISFGSAVSHLSDIFRYSDNCRYLLPCAFAFITSVAYLPSPQINGYQDGALTIYGQVRAYTVKGVPRSLAICGLGGPHITNVLGLGGLMSWGGPISCLQLFMFMVR